MNLQFAILSYRVTDLVLDCLHSVAKEIGSVPETRVTVCENGAGPAAAVKNPALHP